MPVLRPGDQTPTLDLRNADDELVSLADLHGQPVIVYFLPEAFTSAEYELDAPSHVANFGSKLESDCRF